ncbi:ribonuclease P protein component [Thiorhodococcus minor]|uniref:Ribonuclease P protein component n=1 Tax=Thiorhodococcus minor TaxID=57489 RepID=A0A6M0K3B9_9GAMM|nr:ribonuclease P protein component [Thiorhodococcus minor]NEV63443.1 ribonuclease P protein component [Thiorhodococcus minor]
MSPAETTGRPNQGLDRALKLTQPREFRRVFAEPSRAAKPGYVLLYRPNGLETARLGLAISKKCARRAVDRNRLKRIARESFRRNRERLPCVDIVVLCARGATTMPSRRLFDTLEQAWATIRKSACADS